MYTKDLKGEDLQRLFTRDTRDAYHFFTRHVDEATYAEFPPFKRFAVRVRLLFIAFTAKLSPARRALFGAALVVFLFGLLELFDGFGLVRLSIIPFILSVSIPTPLWEDGTGWLLIGFVLVNLLVLLEVADRLTLKNDLEIARQIQLSMLPQHTQATPGIEAAGRTRPANTVGGDYYDIRPLPDGRLLIMLGDVSGKGSPAALLMALVVAMLRTLAPEDLTLVGLVTRLNRLVYEQTPGSRFITMFIAVVEPTTGTLTFINAGQTPPLVCRTDGSIEPLSVGGMALGMFDGATYKAAELTLGVGDLVVAYSDGVTEAENPAGVPFDEIGLRNILAAHQDAGVDELGATIFRAVEQYAADTKLADDLTVLAIRRLPPLPID